METQAKRTITTKKVIEHFKRTGTDLSEEEAEQYLDMLYFFAEQTVRVYHTSKVCKAVSFSRIEPKKAENVNYNILAKKILVRR
jgi:hypothetical protein